MTKDVFRRDRTVGPVSGIAVASDWLLRPVSTGDGREARPFLFGDDELARSLPRQVVHVPSEFRRRAFLGQSGVPQPALKKYSLSRSSSPTLRF